jgi:hypothetical protein
VEKVKKQQNRLEENKKVELDDDTFNKLYEGQGESGYQKYKDKKSKNLLAKSNGNQSNFNSQH